MNDLSEKEQLEKLRAWWSENGKAVLIGAAVAIAGVVGWNRWQAQTTAHEIEASMLFDTVLEARNDGDVNDGANAMTELWLYYADSPYAAQASLVMARLYMENGRDQDAADALNRIVEAEPESELAMVARVRLAKILLYQDKADDVIELVQEHMGTGFDARFNEVLGDAYVALGEFDKARAAYGAALDDNPGAPTVDVQVIQLKMNDLPATGDGELSPAEALAAGQTAEIPEQASPDGGEAEAGNAEEPAAGGEEPAANAEEEQE